MEFANYNPRMMRHLVEQCVFGVKPFVLFDVGCAGGLDSLWRRFGDQLAAVGFDPQQSEIERLRNTETNPQITYVASLIGLPDRHEFHQCGQKQGSRFYEYFNAFERTSAAALWRRGSKQQSNVIKEDLTPTKTAISEYARAHSVAHIDFIKIDTDGHDLEAVLSAEDIIRPCGVLGFMIESPFTGGHGDTENSFHNIDRLMRKNGFIPYGIAVRQYSREALPARFLLNIPAQTVSGPVLWADVVYLRDGASSQYLSFWGEELEPIAILKLACLYELFGVSDCAAELLVAHRDRLSQTVDVDQLLDFLVPPLDDEQLNYRQYIEKFRSDPSSFYPHNRIKMPVGLLGRIARAIGS
jgi:FkbM family methyltransferase